MIYYPKINLCFVHIPRTAGRSIKECMFSNLVHRNITWKLPHMLLKDCIEDLPKDVRIFTVYRNEQDRINSCLKNNWIAEYVPNQNLKLTFNDYVGDFPYIYIIQFTNLIDDLNLMMKQFKLNINFDKLKKIE